MEGNRHALKHSETQTDEKLVCTGRFVFVKTVSTQTDKTFWKKSTSLGTQTTEDLLQDILKGNLSNNGHLCDELLQFEVGQIGVENNSKCKDASRVISSPGNPNGKQQSKSMQVLPLAKSKPTKMSRQTMTKSIKPNLSSNFHRRKINARFKNRSKKAISFNKTGQIKYVGEEREGKIIAKADTSDGYRTRSKTGSVKKNMIFKNEKSDDDHEKKEVNISDDEDSDASWNESEVGDISDDEYHDATMNDNTVGDVDNRKDNKDNSSRASEDEKVKSIKRQRMVHGDRKNHEEEKPLNLVVLNKFFYGEIVQQNTGTIENNAFIDFNEGLEKSLQHLQNAFKNEMYHCKFCGKAIKSKVNWQGHELQHIASKEFLRLSCTYCFKEFDSYSKMRRHFNMVHSTFRPYKCRFCGLGFPHKGNYERHLKRHGGDSVRSFSKDKKRKGKDVAMNVNMNVQEELRQNYGNKNEKSEHSSKRNYKIMLESQNCKDTLSESRSNKNKQTKKRLEWQSDRGTNVDIVSEIQGGLENKVNSKDNVINNFEDSFDGQYKICDLASILNISFVVKNGDEVIKDYSHGISIEDELHVDSSTCKVNEADSGNMISHNDSDSTIYTKQLYKCKYCPRRFRLKSYYLSHEISHLAPHNQLQFQCSLCQKELSSLGRLNTHFKLFHSNIKPYKCKVCEETFPLKSNYIKHFAKHNTLGLENNEMEKIDEEAAHNLRNDEDLKGTEDFMKCPEKIFDLSSVLNVSFVVKRGGEIVKDYSNGMSINEETVDSTSVAVLQNSCGNEYIAPDPGFKTNSPDKSHTEQIYKCQYCPRHFRLKSYCLSHEISHLGPLDQLQFQCSLCQKEFTSLGRLNTHFKNFHSSIKPYTCKVCGKHFRLKSSYMSHFSRHKRLCLEKDETEENGRKMASEFMIMNDKDLMDNEHFMKCDGDDETLKSDIESSMVIEENTLDTPNVLKESVNDVSFVIKEGEDIVSSQSFELDFEKIRDYQCKNCFEIVEGRSNYLSHEISHITDKQNLTFECSVCKSEFTNIHEFTQHFKLEHSVFKSYDCSICSESFSSKLKLDNHISMHSIACQICNKKFLNKSERNLHQKVCYEMEKQSIEQISARKSKNSVDRQTMLQCECCDKAFMSQKQLERHLHVKDCRRENDEKRAGYPCPECGKVFKVPYRVTAHYRAVHTQIRPFECEICGQVFPFNSRLRSHQRYHHGGDKFRFLCSYCPKKFASNHSCQRHEKLHLDPNSDVEKYKKFCTFCDKWITKQTFNRHMLGHMGIHVKTVMCDICGKQFGNKCNLGIHMRIHTGEKPFKCDQCGRAFNTRSSLRRHLKFHAGFKKEAKWLCDICGKGFTLDRGRRKHQVRHSESGLYECEICKMKYPVQELLDKHLAKSIRCANGIAPDVSFIMTTAPNVEIDFVENEGHVASLEIANNI